MLKGQKVLVTAGPTQESLDPVRYLSNHSSGKMGYAIVDELVKQGAIVTLISGPCSLVPSARATVIDVKSSSEMFEAVSKYRKDQDGFIFSAAVADYTPIIVSDQKLKKKGETLHLSLKKTKDIAYEIGKLKRDDQFSVGFALETNDEESNAIAKMNSKNFDFIVLNSMKNKGTCFGFDNNKITILSERDRLVFDEKPKELVAIDIIHFLNNYTK